MESGIEDKIESKAASNSNMGASICRFFAIDSFMQLCAVIADLVTIAGIIVLAITYKQYLVSNIPIPVVEISPLRIGYTAVDVIQNSPYDNNDTLYVNTSKTLTTDKKLVMMRIGEYSAKAVNIGAGSAVNMKVEIAGSDFARLVKYHNDIDADQSDDIQYDSGAISPSVPVRIKTGDNVYELGYLSVEPDEQTNFITLSKNMQLQVGNENAKSIDISILAKIVGVIALKYDYDKADPPEAFRIRFSYIDIYKKPKTEYALVNMRFNKPVDSNGGYVLITFDPSFSQKW